MSKLDAAKNMLGIDFNERVIAKSLSRHNACLYMRIVAR